MQKTHLKKKNLSLTLKYSEKELPSPKRPKCNRLWVENIIDLICMMNCGRSTSTASHAGSM